MCTKRDNNITIQHKLEITNTMCAFNTILHNLNKRAEVTYSCFRVMCGQQAQYVLWLRWSRALRRYHLASGSSAYPVQSLAISVWVFATHRVHRQWLEW